MSEKSEYTNVIPFGKPFIQSFPKQEMMISDITESFRRYKQVIIIVVAVAAISTFMLPLTDANGQTMIRSKVLSGRAITSNDLFPNGNIGHDNRGSNIIGNDNQGTGSGTVVGNKNLGSTSGTVIGNTNQGTSSGPVLGNGNQGTNSGTIDGSGSKGTNSGNIVGSNDCCSNSGNLIGSSNQGPNTGNVLGSGHIVRQPSPPPQ